MRPDVAAWDPQMRIDFANEFIIRYDAEDDCPIRILFTDEAHFNLNGNVNTKYCVRWANTYPHTVASVLLLYA